MMAGKVVGLEFEILSKLDSCFLMTVTTNKVGTFKFCQNGSPNPGRSHKNIIIYLKLFFTEHLKNKDTDKIYGLMQIIIFL